MCRYISVVNLNCSVVSTCLRYSQNDVDRWYASNCCYYEKINLNQPQHYCIYNVKNRWKRGSAIHLNLLNWNLHLTSSIIICEWTKKITWNFYSLSLPWLKREDTNEEAHYSKREINSNITISFHGVELWKPQVFYMTFEVTLFQNNAIFKVLRKTYLKVRKNNTHIIIIYIIFIWKSLQVINSWEY